MMSQSRFQQMLPSFVFGIADMEAPNKQKRFLVLVRRDWFKKFPATCTLQ